MAQIELVDEYPIPFEPDGIVEIQRQSLERDYGWIQSEDDIIDGVDEFHEKWVDELLRTDEWVFFVCGWESTTGWIYVWNHLSGFGFKFESDWETACALIDAFDQFTDEYSSEDFEPAQYAWQIP